MPNAPVEVPSDIVERVTGICLALPEVAVRVDGWAQSFDIRRRSFCLLIAVERDGRNAPLLILRSVSPERDVLLAIGLPYFVPRQAREDRLGVLITPETDWGEIRELVTDSYRVLAPKKLIALID